MCDLEQYRAAIGLFHAKNYSSVVYWRRHISTLYLLFKALCMIASTATNMQFILLILSLITMYGDIELNPGPIDSDESFDHNHSPMLSSEDGNNSSFFFSLLYIKFIHLNVRSLLPNFDIISAVFSRFDIIALSETFSETTIDDDTLLTPGFYEKIEIDMGRCMY